MSVIDQIHDEVTSFISLVNDYVSQHPDKTDEDTEGFRVLLKGMEKILLTHKEQTIIEYWLFFKSENNDLDEENFEIFVKFSPKEKEIFHIFVKICQIFFDYLKGEVEDNFIVNLNEQYQLLLNYVEQKK
jgi:hypothetical protein